MTICISRNLSDLKLYCNSLTRTIRVNNLDNATSVTRHVNIWLNFPLEGSPSWQITLVTDQRTSFRSFTLRSSNTILRLWLITISIRQQVLITSSNLNSYLNSLSRTIRVGNNHLRRLVTRSRSIYRTIKLKLSTLRQLTLISNTLSSIRITTLSNNDGLTFRLKLISLSSNLSDSHRDLDRISRTIRVGNNHLRRLVTRSRSIYRTIKLKLSTLRQLTLIGNCISRV